MAKQKCVSLKVKVFSDRDIATKRDEIERALSKADVFFGSLLFDYDQVSLSQRLRNDSVMTDVSLDLRIQM